MKLKVLIFILAIAGFQSLAQVTKNFIDQNYIEVIGIAEMDIVPDEIYMTILVKETDKPKRTVEEAEKILVDKLKELGIEIKSNLVVLDFLSSAKVSFLNRDVVTSKKYQLVLPDAKTVAKVFNTLEAQGFTNMNIARVNHSRLDDFKKEVKLKAIKLAQEKAKGIMNAIGQDIGKALFVEEVREPFYGAQPFTSNAIMRAPSMESFGRDKLFEDLNFDTLTLKSYILVRFEIK